MNTTLSEAIKDAYASVPNNKTVLDTLSIINPVTNEIIYLANDADDHILTLESGETVLFEKSAFSFKLPNAGSSGRQDLSLQMDNNDRRILDFIIGATENAIVNSKVMPPCECVYRPYLLPDTSAPQMDPPLTLTLKGGQVKDGVISAKATFADVLNTGFPDANYTRERFPNLGI